MKYISLFCLALCLMLSCKKEIGTQSVNGTFTMKVDGALWPANENQAVINVQNGILQLSAEGTDQTVEFLVECGPEAQPGTYQLTPGDNRNGAVLSRVESNQIASFATYHGGLSGGLLVIDTINQIDTTMSGQFLFTAKSEQSSLHVIVNEGKFTDVPFRRFNSVTGGIGGSSTASCKVDGSNFTPDRIHVQADFSALRILIATNLAMPQIILELPPDIASGTYDLSYLQGNTVDLPVARYMKDCFSFHISNGGQLVITAHDQTQRTISGTFSFSTKDLYGSATVHQVKDGSFSVAY